jgi:hypothetical protein
MTTSYSPDLAPTAETPTPVAAPRSPKPWPGWLREPLLHFVALGGVLFGVDHLIASKAENRNVIVVGEDVNHEAVETFEASRGRKPNAEELRALHKVWLDNEVLYREGLALQVDKGDPAIRERVIFKALSVVDSQVKLPLPDEKTLRAWFETHRPQYDEPARFDFEEAALSGDSSETAVREFVKALNDGMPGDAKAGLRVFKGRPYPNLVQSYGLELAKALEAAPPHLWQALSTKDGWRALRLVAMTPPKAGDFESLRGVVLQVWKDAVASEQRSATVAELTRKYVVKYEEHVDRHGD